MDSIGEKLKEARISSGVNLKEASEDLGIKEAILENIESGSIGCFKDKLIDEFNEYLFEYTSKIPVKEIEKRVSEQQKEKVEEKVVSPYTKPMKRYPSKYYIALYTVLILVAIGIIIWSVMTVMS